MMTDKELGLLEKAIYLAETSQEIIRENGKQNNTKEKKHFYILTGVLGGIIGALIVSFTIIACVEIKESYNYTQDIAIENISESKSESEIESKTTCEAKNKTKNKLESEE